MKAAPIELLNSVKLIYQLRLAGSPLLALFAINVAGARFNRCDADARIERGIEQLA